MKHTTSNIRYGTMGGNKFIVGQLTIPLNQILFNLLLSYFFKIMSILTAIDSISHSFYKVIAEWYFQKPKYEKYS